MKVTWLGQAGLLFETGGLVIIVDPYLSDSVAKVTPAQRRRTAVDEAFLQIHPDVLVFTHNHLDHYDPETVSHYLNGTEGITVLSPVSVWTEVRKFGGTHNYVQFNAGTEWSCCDKVHFSAVPAAHSDPAAIGVILTSEGKKYYVTGDTLYNRSVLASLPEHIDTLFLPVNGVGNNMNMEDAARFAQKVGAEHVVPVHFGLFDDLTAEEFDCPNKIIPEIYKEVPL